MSEPKSYSARQSVDAAVDLFRTFTDGQPDLIPTGIARIDECLGGMGPGSTMILGADNGIGKSLVSLDAAITNAEAGVCTGILSCEDTPDVLGSRILARASNVDSLKIRRKCFNAVEEKRLKDGAEKVRALEDDLRIAYHVGSPLEDVVDGLKGLADEGCRLVWMDYIQKIRGSNKLDRRNQVSGAYTTLHRTAYELGVGICFLSQISRQIDGRNRIPSRNALKESGDLENEARLILMLGRLDSENPNSVDGKLDKSTFGGEGMHLNWQRGACGGLFQRAGEADGKWDDF